MSSFQDTWPRLNSAELLPPITWSESRAPTDEPGGQPDRRRDGAGPGHGYPQTGFFKPNELVMREILCIASAVMDETFLSDPRLWTWRRTTQSSEPASATPPSSRPS
ncbi:hypothetical protein ACRAWD_31180 [Caulobacter segnis]